MRSGHWRGARPAFGLAAAALALGLAMTLAAGGTARAQDFHTIPRLVPAVDLNTGGPYYAPPIPAGHYTGKNCLGKASGLIHGCLGKLHGCGPCGGCGGKGCGLCGGSGKHCGDPCGGCGGQGCGLCGGTGLCGTGTGTGKGKGGGLFHHHKQAGYGTGVVLCEGGTACGGSGGGLFHHKHGAGSGSGSGYATTDVVASAQGAGYPVGPPIASSQCGDPGCGLFGAHRHRGCGLCGGKGCGSCLDPGDPCGACGGKGCGLCGGKSHGLCKNCGGRGCNLCSRLRGLFGHHRVKWFVGPGGPVPLTPGYTPYVNVTRSPRDFLAFPPFVP
jgi:hypothetical protein